MRDILSPIDSQIVTEVFNVVRRSYAGNIPEHIIRNLELSRQIEYISGELLYRLDAYLASQEEIFEEPEIQSKTETSPVESSYTHDFVEVPSSWWDMFKRDVLKRYLPLWLASKFEVYTDCLCTVTVNNFMTRKYITQTIIKKTVIRPDIEVPDKHQKHFDMFTRRTYQSGRVPYSA
jgi:hypothetical protein